MSTINIAKQLDQPMTTAALTREPAQPYTLWQRIRRAWDAFKERKPPEPPEAPTAIVTEQVTVNVAEGLDAFYEALYQHQAEHCDPPSLVLLPAPMYVALPHWVRQEQCSPGLLRETDDGWMVLAGVECRPAGFIDKPMPLGSLNVEMNRT